MRVAHFSLAKPALRCDPFNPDDFIFELKMDGFRALAHVGPDETRPVSRNVNEAKRRLSV
jgi:ATP-dependent DNA ligase